MYLVDLSVIKQVFHHQHVLTHCGVRLGVFVTNPVDTQDLGQQSWALQGKKT